MNGLASPGQPTLLQRAPQSTGCDPPRAIAAPTSPPMSACDDDEGRPSRHVRRFQTIAPSSAASSTCAVTNPASVLIRPPPTVFATLVDVNAPAKFMTAAIATAVRGLSARVDTEVATALAVSWKPFVKSKASAIAITTTSSAVAHRFLR